MQQPRAVTRRGGKQARFAQSVVHRQFSIVEIGCEVPIQLLIASRYPHDVDRAGVRDLSEDRTDEHRRCDTFAASCADPICIIYDPGLVVGNVGNPGTDLDQEKYIQAETEYREALKLHEQALGPEHPDTLSTYYRLALCLQAEKKLDEAKAFARRAVEGAGKVLGTNHPDTLKYEKLWWELQMTNSQPQP